MSGNVTQASVDATGGTFNLQSGKLVVPTIVGNLNQSGGTYSPGNGPAIGSISGNYTKTAGALEIDISGDQTGQFSQVNVGGNATLNSTLTLDFLGGFVPAQYDQFRILNVGGTRTGMFGLSEGASLGNGMYITFLAGDGNDVELFSGLTPGAVSINSAASNQSAYTSGNYSTSNAGQTYTFKSLDVLPGANTILGPNDTLVLTDGPLYIAPAPFSVETESSRAMSSTLVYYEFRSNVSTSSRTSMAAMCNLTFSATD